MSPQHVLDAVANTACRLTLNLPFAEEVVSRSRYLMHLGHPEYTPQRLVEEYRGDQALERGDAGPPHGIDLEEPERGYRSHGPRFFAHWQHQLRLARQRA